VQLLRSKCIFAVATLALLIGGAAAAYGLLQPPTSAAPGAQLAAPQPTRVAAFSPADVGALAALGASGGAPGGALGAAPQQAYSGYKGYRDAILSLGGGLRDFYFTRGIYSSWRGGYGRRGRSWDTDYPKADRQFLWGFKRITNIDTYDNENAVLLTDPDLRRYPFLYMLEVGYMQLTPPEVEGLRDYLAAGGFLFIDDFWGTNEWENFEWEIHKVLPGSDIVELPADHPLFSTFYVIDEVLQVPSIRIANYPNGPTWERDGYTPHVRAIFDERDRLIVLINWNTDLGDAWEWAENPFYPLEYSNYAYQMAINTIIYAMSH
jgi:hypothetical protein